MGEGCSGSDVDSMSAFGVLVRHHFHNMLLDKENGSLCGPFAEWKAAQRLHRDYPHRLRMSKRRSRERESRMAEWLAVLEQMKYRAGSRRFEL